MYLVVRFVLTFLFLAPYQILAHGGESIAEETSGDYTKFMIVLAVVVLVIAIWIVIFRKKK